MRKVDLNTLSDAEILALRIKDIRLLLPQKYTLQIKKLNAKLKEKGINWRPYFWFSEEWFSPDGIDGIAMPFVLSHPRLIKLEKNILGHCEGERLNEFYKIICHEVGHAIDNRFKLRLKKRRQTLFGKSSKAYPSSYTPKPDSTDYVEFLGDFYAQAHPDEDWAETFAVWLSTSNWKSKYRHTKALEKLQYIDELMRSLPKTKSRKSNKTYLNAKKDNRTIADYLKQKKKMLGKNRHNFFTHIVSNDFEKVRRPRAIDAVSFISQNELKFTQTLARNKKVNRWYAEKFLKELKQECKEKRYSLKHNQIESKKMLEQYFDEHFDEFIKKGKTKVFM